MIQHGDHRAHGIERATIEVETGDHSPHGAPIAADGRRHVFAGWAELGAALEDWRTVARRRDLVHRASPDRPQSPNERNHQ